MWLPFGMKDSKGKAKELSQWESDLRRREAVRVAVLFPWILTINYSLHGSWLNFLFFGGIFWGQGYQEEGGSSQEWYASALYTWLSFITIRMEQEQLIMFFYWLIIRWRSWGAHGGQELAAILPNHPPRHCQWDTSKRSEVAVSCVRELAWYTCIPELLFIMRDVHIELVFQEFALLVQLYSPFFFWLWCTGIVLCLFWNFIAVIVCWIRGGGELSISSS